jgi:DNA modification methylase
MGARKLGLTQVPCIRLAHLTEAQRRAYVIADNKLALNAGWDEEMLRLEIGDLKATGYDLGMTGFSDTELDEMLALNSAVTVGGTDPDDVPATPVTPTSHPGDVWKLGKHRVMCGDSTSTDAMQKLFAGEMADCCWTDPPYNVAYGDKTEYLNKGNNTRSQRNTSRILNDDMDDASFRDFLRGFYSAAWSVMKPGAAIYVAHAETERTNFTAAFLESGFKLSSCVIWKKDSLVLGRSDYQWMHEPIIYGWKEGAAHKFYGGRKQTTIVQLGDDSPFVKLADGRYQITIGEQVLIVDGEATVDWVEHSIMRELKPKRNDVHPTMKPVALIERMLKNSAKPGQVVLDSFGGSGSTLIACERLGMSSRLMELSENYVDVIVRRWQEFTGGSATLEGDGRTFNQIAEAGR